MNFTIDEDVGPLADAIGEFLSRTCDPVAIAEASTKRGPADRGRWTALCELGLPLLTVDEPAGIGAGLLGATALAERLGAALLPEPAVSTIVLSGAWHRHGHGADAFIADLIGGAHVAWFNPFDVIQLSDGRVRGRALVPTDELTDLVALIADLDGHAEVVVLEAAGLKPSTRSPSPDAICPAAAVDVDAAPVAGLTLPHAGARRLRHELTLLTLAELVGGMDAVLSRTVRHVTDRRQFGRSIGSFQAVKHQLADMYAATERARAAVQLAAIELDAGRADAPHGIASVARGVPRAAIELCERAIHLHGAMGYSWEVPVHLYLRNAIVARERLGRAALFEEPR